MMVRVALSSRSPSTNSLTQMCLFTIVISWIANDGSSVQPDLEALSISPILAT
jgi:hypothetical protein